MPILNPEKQLAVLSFGRRLVERKPPVSIGGVLVRFWPRFFHAKRGLKTLALLETQV
jgi:hypothetical protein